MCSLEIDYFMGHICTAVNDVFKASKYQYTRIEIFPEYSLKFNYIYFDWKNLVQCIT